MSLFVFSLKGGESEATCHGGAARRDREVVCVVDLLNDIYSDWRSRVCHVLGRV